MTDTIYKASFSITLAFPKGSRDAHEHEIEYAFTEHGNPLIVSIRRGCGSNLLCAFSRSETDEAFLPFVKHHRYYQSTQPGQAK